MRPMNAYIEIGDYKFTRVNEVTINTSRKTLTDTAKIKLPNLAGKLEKAIKKGDAVLIQLGYDGVLHDEFKGYVSSISPKIPVEISCQDEMWKLKQQEISNSWKSIKLTELLNILVPGGNIEAPDITLSPFRLPRATKYKALEKIKETYGIDIYYRDGKLFAGLAYTESDLGSVKYHFQKNLPYNSVQNLEYKASDDVKIKLTAISMLPSNKKYKVELGDEDGETRTLHYYNKTEAELKQLAEQHIDLLKYDGYRGKFKAFGSPLVKHSMIADLFDTRYPSREGSYFIDSVNTTYSTGGFRRDIELGKKAVNE